MTDLKPMREVINRLSDIPNINNTLLKLGEIYRVEEIESKINDINDLLPNIKNIADKIAETKDNKLIDNALRYIKDLAEYVTAIGMLHLLYLQTVDMEIAIMKTVMAPLTKNEKAKAKLKSAELENGILGKLRQLFLKNKSE
jgi:L-lactate utilization protein LutB